MSIQGIGGLSSSAVFGNAATTSGMSTQKNETQVTSKLGSLQNSEIGSTNLITASLSTVTGKDTSAQMGRYTDLCTSLLSQQAKNANGLASYYSASGSAIYSASASMINISVNVSDGNGAVHGMSSAEAAQAVSSSGDWGADAVASRIMDMAVSLSGGDTDNIDVLEQAVMKGFQNAYSLLGGEDKTAEITKKTKDEIKKRFDYWRENGSLDGYRMTEDAAEADDDSDLSEDDATL
jgi:hypothetical protein